MTTTSADIFRRAGVSGNEKDEQARRAVKAFRALQPTLTAYARMLTKNKRIRVEMAARDNGSTDGTKIYYRPPMALGDNTPHDRRLCDKRDDFGNLRCRACDIREDVLVIIYHEIAHIAFDSFQETSDEDKAQLLERAIAEHGGKYAKELKKRIDSAPFYAKGSYIGMASIISQYLPLLVNALEDARVNRELFKARPGTKIMFDAQTAKTFNEGVEQVDRETGEVITVLWKDYAQNMQALVGVFCKASGYKYDNWFIPPVVEALNDTELTNLVNRLETVRNARDVYALSFPVLARLRELGFCKLPEDPEPEPEPEPDQENTDGDNDDEGPADAEDDDGTSDEGLETDDDPGTGGGPPDPDAAGGSQDDDGEGTGSVPGADADEGDDADAGDEPAEPGDAGGAGAPSGTDDGPDETDAGDPAEGEPAGEVDPEQDGGGAGGEGEESGSVPDDDPVPGGEAGKQDDAVPDADDAGAGPSEGDDVPGDTGAREAGDDPDGEGVPEAAAEPGAEAEADGSDLDADEGPVDDGSESDGEDAAPEGADGSAGDEELESDAGITGTGEVGDDAALGEGTGGDLDADTGGGGEDREGADGGSVGSDGEQLDPDGDAAGSAEGPGADDGADPNFAPTTGGSEDHPAEAAEAAPLDDDALDDEGAIDTGADDGTGGVELIEKEEYDDVPMGTPEEARIGLQKWGGHEDKPKTVEEELEEAIMDRAIIQGIYFETPSQEITGVREHKWDQPQMVLMADGSEMNMSQAWDHSMYRSYGYDLKELGVEAEAGFSPSETQLGPALMRMRVAFSENQRGSNQRNLKSGRINGRSLAKRVPAEDPRMFRKRTQPGKRDYFVLLGIDVSGSTVGRNIKLEKRAVMAQAELLQRMGIRFAIFAHSGNYHAPARGRAAGLDLDIYLVKEPGEPWSDAVKHRLAELGPDSANLDGHTMEYYRKVLDRVDATDKIIMYYTDGQMPAENHDEELEILQRELKICKQKGYTVMGVGIRTDSPIRHGLDTVQVDTEEDVIKVVKHLEKRLLET